MPIDLQNETQGINVTETGGFTCIHIQYVKCFPLTRNIILIKSSLLRVSVAPPPQKKSPASHSSLISVYLRTVLTLAVTIFNKLDPKEHASRDTEMELTFSQCQDLQRVY